MKPSKILSNGSKESLPSFTLPVKKPLTESPSEDVSFCIETVSGKHVNPTSPNPETIDINDIAWALSRIARFAGHTVTEKVYNVAQHSIYVSELLEGFISGELSFTEVKSASTWKFQEGIELISKLDAEHQKRFLMKSLLHDAHEAYIGDIPSPIKRIPELTETLKILELRLDHAIFSKLLLDETSETEKQMIKFVDKLAQAIEGYQFMPSRGLTWELPAPSLSLIQQFPQPMSPLQSYKAFLDRYYSLTTHLWIDIID